MREHHFIFVRMLRRGFGIVAIFLIATVLGIGTLHAQTLNSTVVLGLDNGSLSKGLKQLEKQSGFKITFDAETVEKYKHLTFPAESRSVQETLSQLLRGTNLSYRVRGTQILIIPKASTSHLYLHGTIRDSKGEELAGVNVKVKGSPIGTTSKSDGKYAFNIPSMGHKTIVFSFIGMKSVEKVVDTSKQDISLNVTMEEDAENLNEVVVTGMFNKKQDSFTGSAMTFSGDKLKTVGNQNVLQSLSMLDPSIVIADNQLLGSDPNAPLNITINGTTSINGLTDMYGSNPNMPLFILDGFETTLDQIKNISMDRVESITTLKDAASSAIYGAKAANGVIVIETKKPVAGKLRFSYSGNYQVAWADLSDYNLMNAEEKLLFEKLSGHYGMLDDNNEIFNDSQRQLYYARLRNVVAGMDSYWLNEPLRTAFTQEHLLNAEGGDRAFRYNLAFRYRKNEGVMKGSDRNNIDGTVNLLYRVKKFNFSNKTNVSYTDADNNLVSFGKFSQANPFYAKRNNEGEVDEILEKYSSANGTAYVTNPLWDLQQKSYKNNKSLLFNNNLIIEYRPIEALRIKGMFGFATSRGEGKNFTSPFATQYISTSPLKRGQYNQSNSNNTTYDGSLLMSYGKMIKQHTVNLVGGAQLTQRNFDSSSFTSIGYITDKFSNPNFSNGYPAGGKPYSKISKSRSASFYINGNYAYDMRYLFDVNLRTDGSSVFGVNNPFSTTWSFGLGWNIHNEKFLKHVKFINMLKLRYSIGNPGNENFDAKIANNIYSYYTAYPNMFGLAAVVSTWGNKNLKWQRTRINNIGLDFQTLNSRLYLTMDYSIKDTDPILLRIDQPSSTGTSDVPMNIGATKNWSFSMSANYFIIQKPDISWQVNLNMIHTKTEYRKIGHLLDKYNEKGRENQSLLRYYDGVSSTAIWAVRSMGIDPMTGNEIFMKKDGSYTFVWNSSDEVICGDLTPDVEGFIGTNFRYKGLSIGANFRYRLGGQAPLNTLLQKVENISDEKLKYNQDKRALKDRWKEVGDKAKFKRIDDTSSTNMSSRFIADDNTLECSSLNIGYENSSAKWLHKMGLSSMRVRLYMNNIFRISTIKEERGLDYPFERSVSASLGLRF